MKHIHATKTLFWPNCLLAASSLLLAGTIYRVAASRLRLIAQTPIVLPIPLSAFPTEIDGWVGKDVPIAKHIQRTAGNDDFLYRFYVHKSTGQRASVYVAYSGRPRTMLGHRPEVCYVADGWAQESSTQSQFLSSAGRAIPCSIHRFYKPTPSHEESVVLNFYILNGQITHNESGFSGVAWRTPNIGGDPARYIAQVQISSVLENSVRTAAKDMTDLILNFFPDQNGKVKAPEYANTTSGVLK